MKKILLSIISIAVCLSISGQQISQSNNHYRGNDVVEKKQVTIKGFDLNSKNNVWSLEDAEFSKATCKAEYTMETDTLMAVERGNRTYYRQDRSAVSIIGLENVQELVSYDMPEPYTIQFSYDKDWVTGNHIIDGSDIQIISKDYNESKGSWKFVHGQTNHRSVFDKIEKALNDKSNNLQKNYIINYK